MSVPLLVNENFPAPSVRHLRAAGWDVVSVSETAPGADDREVLARAVRERRWLVTFDRDYGDLIFARGNEPPPALILLRVPSYRPEQPAQWLMDLTQDQQSLLGTFAVFNGRSVRKRPFLRQASSDRR